MLEYNAVVHELLGSYPWLDNLKRKLQNDRLFAYQHRVHGSLVLCVWAYTPAERSPGWFIELEVQEGGNPQMDWPFALHPEVMLERLQEDPVERWERILRARRDKAHEEQQYKDRVAEQRVATAKVLAGQGLAREANQVLSGMVPLMPAGSEDARHMQDILRVAARLDGKKPTKLPS